MHKFNANYQIVHGFLHSWQFLIDTIPNYVVKFYVAKASRSVATFLIPVNPKLCALINPWQACTARVCSCLVVSVQMTYTIIILKTLQKLGVKMKEEKKMKSTDNLDLLTPHAYVGMMEMVDPKSCITLQRPGLGIERGDGMIP